MIILILTLFLSFIFLQYIHQDHIDLLGRIKKLLSKTTETTHFKPHNSVRVVKTTRNPQYIHNERFGLWFNEYEKQQRLEILHEIGGKEQQEVIQFVNATDVTFDSKGNLYVLDRGYKTIEVFDREGKHVKRLGVLSKRRRIMHDPSDLVIDENGNLYIADRRKGIIILNANGQLRRILDTPYVIEQIVLDSKNHIIALTPQHKFFLHKFTSYGRELMAFGEQEEPSVELRKAFSQSSLAIDADDNIYVSYVYPYRIVKYSPEGEPLLTFDRELEITVTPPTIERDKQNKIKRIVRQAISYDIHVSSEGLIYNLVRIKGAMGGDVLDMYNTSGQYLITFYLGGNYISFDLFKDQIALLSPFKLQRVERYRFVSLH